MWSHPSEGFGRNVVIIGVDMSLSVHANNKKTKLLVIGEGIIQIDSTKLIAEKIYSDNFTENCIIMELIVICLSMVQKLLNLRQRIPIL